MVLSLFIALITGAYDTIKVSCRPTRPLAGLASPCLPVGPCMHASMHGPRLGL